MGDIELRTRTLITGIGTEVFALQFSDDGQVLAAGCGDGKARFYHAASGRLISEVGEGVSAKFPACSLAFRPGLRGSRQVCATAHAEGIVNHWQVHTGKLLHTLHEPGNETYAIAYSPNGLQFATAGRDRVVRVYDAASRTLQLELAQGTANSAGHSNRIFAVKFHPTDPNLLLSAGFDHTVQIWDLRVGKSVRSVYGANVCGQALDIHDSEILTGSARPATQLELWDLHTTDQISDLHWPDAASLYCACFSPNGEHLAAGGYNPNGGRVLTSDGDVVGAVTEDSAVYACAFAPSGRFAAFGTANGTIRVVHATGGTSPA